MGNKISKIKLPGNVTPFDIGADWSNISNKPTIITANDVDTAINNKLAANDAMLFKGTLGTDGTVVNLPTYGYQAGWTYKIVNVGTWAGELCEVGDMLIAIKDGPTSGSSVINADWAKLQNNVDVFNGATSSVAGARGLVPAPASGDQNKYLKGDGTWAAPDSAPMLNSGNLVTSGGVYTELNKKLDRTGGTMSGNIAMGGNLITNLGTPSSDNDAVTKSYVDTGLAGKQATLTFDNTPTANSENPVKSGGIYSTLNNKADLNSPALTGVPTAPTAAYGTSTTQIATTAFVQQAIRPNIIINISDIPSGTSATVTASLIGSEPLYSVSETIDSSGLASLTLDYTGEYQIAFNNPQIKGNPTINATVPKIYTYNGYWSENVTYTVLIDKNNNNTSTACTYADDALGMTKGSSEWDSMPIFKHIRPCVFQSGYVNYYLNPNNWNEKYGTGEASILTGEDGDVMIEFPKFAYKIETNDNIITVSVSNDDDVIANDSAYTYDAFSRLEEGDLEYFYKGAFKGSLDEAGNLRSIAGVKPANNKTIGAFRSAAQQNGAHYQQSTYAQLKALQCLYLIKYGDRDGQSAVGKGVVSASESYVTGYNTTSVDTISSENSTLASGMTFGTTANGTTHMHLFGIEDFWGCIWEWVDGLTTDGNRNIITSWNSFSNEGISATTVSTPSGLTANANGWNKNIAGNTAAGFMPIEFGGSSSTYWADYGALSASCVLYFGGRWNYGDNAGPFYLDAGSGASAASANVGARLSYA